MQRDGPSTGGQISGASRCGWSTRAHSITAFNCSLTNRQSRVPSKRALTRFTGEQIRVRGASRTDSGAHAQGQVVDFPDPAPGGPLTGSRLPSITSCRKISGCCGQRRWRRSFIRGAGPPAECTATGCWFSRSRPPLLRHTHLWVRGTSGRCANERCGRGLGGNARFQGYIVRASQRPTARSERCGAGRSTATEAG